MQDVDIQLQRPGAINLVELGDLHPDAIGLGGAAQFSDLRPDLASRDYLMTALGKAKSNAAAEAGRRAGYEDDLTHLDTPVQAAISPLRIATRIACAVVATPRRLRIRRR